MSTAQQHDCMVLVSIVSDALIALFDQPRTRDIVPAVSSPSDARD